MPHFALIGQGVDTGAPNLKIRQISHFLAREGDYVCQMGEIWRSIVHLFHQDVWQQKTKSPWAIVWHCLCDFTFSHFDTIKA